MLEACAWLAKQGPSLKLALLVGHWDVSGMGCDADMAMPSFYEWVRHLPGCKEFDERPGGMLRWVTGHTHCNTPHPHHSMKGYRVAGYGMPGDGSNGCDGNNFGIPVLDTTDGRARWWYFDTSTDELYDQVITCVKNEGWRQCTENATLWMNVTLDDPGKENATLYTV